MCGNVKKNVIFLGRFGDAGGVGETHQPSGGVCPCNALSRRLRGEEIIPAEGVDRPGEMHYSHRHMFFVPKR